MSLGHCILMSGSQRHVLHVLLVLLMVVLLRLLHRSVKGLEVRRGRGRVSVEAGGGRRS